MVRPHRALVSVLLTLVLAGCADAGLKNEETQRPQATFDETTGGIEGIVVDPEYRPIPGAQLQLIGVPQVVNSSADGRFAFSDLIAQDYLLIAKATGFFEAQVPASVPAGNVTELRVTLQPVPPPVPYADPVHRYAGKFDAAIAVRASTVSYNFTRSSTSGNVGKADFVPRADWQSILLEVFWTPTRAEADMMTLKVYYPEQLDGGSVSIANSIFVPAGKSPLQWRMDREEFEELRKTRPRLSFSTFLGVTYQVYPATDQQSAYDYGLYVEQPFIVYGTVGYNGPLPTNYTRAEN